MSVSEDLQAIKAQLLKAKAEIKGKLAELATKVEQLEAALASASVTDPAVDAAIADVKGVAQEIDDLVPDVVEEIPAEQDPAPADPLVDAFDDIVAEDVAPQQDPQ